MINVQEMEKEVFVEESQPSQSDSSGFINEEFILGGPPNEQFIHEEIKKEIFVDESQPPQSGSRSAIFEEVILGGPPDEQFIDENVGSDANTVIKEESQDNRYVEEQSLLSCTNTSKNKECHYNKGGSLQHLQSSEQQSITQGSGENYQCKICNKVLRDSYHLTIHTSAVHSDGIMKFKCDVCGVPFSLSRSLSRHKLIEHGVKYKCDICDESFSVVSSLSKHKLIQHGVKSYRCDICNKMYGNASGLSVHKLSHRGVKKYQCTTCNTGFNKSSDLKRHRLIVHCGIKNYQCDVCKKTFGWSSCLASHNKLVHKVI